ADVEPDDEPAIVSSTHWSRSVALCFPSLTARRNRGDRREILRRPLAPADREPIRVAQIHVVDALQVGGKRRRHDFEESMQPLVDVAAAEPDLLAAAELEKPRAALVELKPLERQAGVGELAAHGEIG